MACTTSPASEGLRQSVAPSWRASANFRGLVSTPMMRSAPAITAPWITERPMPPRPKTATLAPGVTLAVFSTAPIPVVTPQPSRHTRSSGASLRIFASADLRQHRRLGEGRRAHVVVEHPAAVGETARTVGHHPLALGCAQCDAEVGLAGEAELALPALRGVERDHVVAGGQRRYARADLLHDAGALVAEYGREAPLRVLPAHGVGVGVADAGGGEPHQHFAGPGAFEVDLGHLERCPRLPAHGGADLHADPSSASGRT